jgi:ferredoxin
MHHSHHLELYERLREKLSKAPIQVPKTLSGYEREILKVLFDEDEVQLALKLPFISFTLEDISQRTGESEEYLKNTLERMAKKGTVFKIEKKGKTIYRLLPVVIGWFETPFFKGPGKDPRQEKLAPLWDEYWKEAWLDEIGDRGTSIMRALPEKSAISNKSVILPYEDAVELVKNRDYHAVAHCACRVMARLAGKGCRHTLENCLSFGSMGKYLVNNGFGRRISVEEALEILERANKEGLVHTTENHSGKVNVICNCCTDCCMFFRAIYEVKYPNVISSSNYYAQVDGDECVACGICSIRCPMNAIKTRKSKEAAQINRERCIGCGVCVTTCPMEALSLVERDEIHDPPDYRTYISKLLSDRGKDTNSLL